MSLARARRYAPVLLYVAVYTIVAVVVGASVNIHMEYKNL